jgi:ankyrin repeat protein
MSKLLIRRGYGPLLLAVLVLPCGGVACSDRSAAVAPPSPPPSPAPVPSPQASTPPYQLVSPPAEPTVIAESMTAGVAAGSPRIASPGTYWPQYACVQFHTQHQFTRWRWCLESVTVRPDGEMVFRCVWERDSHSAGGIEKGSDEGNRNMYVVDARGTRYDPVALTEFARLGGQLTEKDPVKRGDYVFRVGGGAHSPFTFHDDDQQATIAVQLDPARMSGTVRRPRPDGEEVTTLLQRMRGADQVELLDSQRTFGRHGGTSSSERYVLRRQGARSGEGVAVPASVLDGFLARLAEAPLLDGPYVPSSVSLHLESRYSITIGTADDPIVFFSESRGADRVPWAVEVSGRRYVIPSDAPARALDLVRPYLSQARTATAPGGGEGPGAPSPGAQGTTDLGRAVQQGDVPAVRRLLAAGADPERGEAESGKSPLHFAAAVGRTDLVTLLIEAGARPDTPDHWGSPPLVEAATNGHLEVVRALLQHGARSGLQDALLSACSKGGVEVVRALLAAGATAGGRSHAGLTPLMHAVGAGSVPKAGVVKLLLESGAAVNDTDHTGRTVLFIAAVSGSGARGQSLGDATEVVRLLLDAGADPLARAKFGRNAIEVLEATPSAATNEILPILRERARR